MLEWERDPTNTDFGCLFQEITTPLHLHTIQLPTLELKAKSISKEHAHTNNQTGLMTWEGGHHLAELVMQCPQLFKDKIVVELGAGSVPLPSIAAWHCGVRELLVSDGNRECVVLAKQNMLRNIQPEIRAPQFAQVVWGADADLSEVFKLGPIVDWVLAADVTYSEQGTRDFFATVVRIAAQVPSIKVAWPSCKWPSFVGAVYFKYSLEHEDGAQRPHPVNFAFARETLASMILCSVAFFSKTAPRREDLPQFLILGTCLFCNQLFYILGAEHSGVVVACCMQPAIPVFTAAIAISLRKESLSVQKSLGIVAASAGVICMIVGSEGTRLTQALGARSEAVMGNLFLLLNTVAMALYYVLSKPVSAKYPPIAVAAWTHVVGAFITGITALVHNQFYQLDWYLPRDAYGPLLYWTLVCSVCKYYILSWAMSILPSTQVATFQCLQPLAGTVLGFIVLGEHLSFWDLGAIAIVAGLLILNRESEKANLKQLNDSEVLKSIV